MSEIELMKGNIENALDMLQIIQEDLEENLIGSHVDNFVTERASLTSSSLDVLRDYLRYVCGEVKA